MVPGNPGNSGGKKGRSGRRPQWFKDWCESLLADRRTRKQVIRILRNRDHPAFKAMWAEVANRAFGKAGEKLELTGKLTLEQLLAKTYRRPKKS